MIISIIIPVLNEAFYIGKLLSFLVGNCSTNKVEIIVVDGGSYDATKEIVESYPVKFLENTIASRAVQMNLGSTVARGDVFYFMHADVMPPATFYADIHAAIQENYSFGFYKQKFESSNPLFVINSFFTRFPFLWCRGADQSMFVTKNLFKKLHGFDEKFVIMEEYDFIQRAIQLSRMKIMNGYTFVSTRKYKKNSWIRVLLANQRAFRMFKNGICPEQIRSFYTEKLKL